MTTAIPLDPALERPSWRESAVVMIGLSVLFLVIYNATNYFTSIRTEVPSFYFSWERHIPFVSYMIVPYMSVDLFFVAAPFICTERRELTILTKRIALAILVAGIFFILFPLKLAVERPIAAGWTGAIYNWFSGMDLPYNLCPSLHIALRTILADLYGRHTRGLTNFASHFWFSLIGFSTLLLYQHHLIDIVGGFILATFCFYLVRDTPLKLPVQSNYRVGLYYGIGTGLLCLLGYVTYPWGVLLIWPAVATGLVCAGYFYWGPGVFRKSAGQIPLTTRIILGPVLWGQYLSWVYYRRQCQPWDAVNESVWIGRRLTDQEAEQATAQGVMAVVDLSIAFSEAAAFRNVAYHHVPVLDLTAPSIDQLEKTIDFIRKHAENGLVYIHCKIGYSRSAAVVGAYLLAENLVESPEAAIQYLRTIRPSIVIRPEAEQAIFEYDSHRKK
ncbi:phosphatase PAP2/dual specificity phosphatase family protein [Gimesia fumaroli]|uniref:Uncharacterized protein n=1 Tax=Gimesia fumaroli TaxID=2527976 RepID=A0A518IJZ4_9PLAN|nr:phosphatase PAP2/dual specificity phosphatase family protein [Gimesia fumaroli]QDV53365.1 hypothetical protein Enr17x_54400 [Gimesia fumaroli]